MAYNRRYSLPEVSKILEASEGRARPDLSGREGAPIGHALTQHTNRRTDYFGRTNSNGSPISRDSTFLAPPEKMIEFVHEALNSVPGQRALVKLNNPTKIRVSIESIIVRDHSSLDIFVVYQPEGDQISFDWTSVTNGNGIVFLLYVLIYKIPNSPTEEIHIQTAFPKDFARLQGEEIVLIQPPGQKR